MSGVILTDKTLESKSQKDKNENINENVNENEHVNDRTLMSSNEDDDKIIKKQCIHMNMLKQLIKTKKVYQRF